jgi:2-polyprenyl-3-methyl-5-hydroxy-6-metoxy-1,4-benzoquinol methylase
MADSTSPTSSQAPPAQANGHKTEATFKKFTATQAASYRALRDTYTPALFDFILAFHDKTPPLGGRVRALDVGCGPGNVTVDLGQHFDHVMGVDHGEGMLETARQAGGTTRSGEAVEYRVSGAEDIDKLEGIGAGSVDLITSGTAVSDFMLGFQGGLLTMARRIGSTCPNSGRLLPRF